MQKFISEFFDNMKSDNISYPSILITVNSCPELHRNFRIIETTNIPAITSDTTDDVPVRIRIHLYEFEVYI